MVPLSKQVFVSLSHLPRLYVLYGICILGWVVRLLKVCMWFLSMYVTTLQLELRGFCSINVDEDFIVFIVAKSWYNAQCEYVLF
jgi:hypothetical protein